MGRAYFRWVVGEDFDEVVHLEQAPKKELTFEEQGEDCSAEGMASAEGQR